MPNLIRPVQRGLAWPPQMQGAAGSTARLQLPESSQRLRPSYTVSPAGQRLKRRAPLRALFRSAVELRPMRQTAKIALAHYTCYPPLARAREGLETGPDPPPEIGNHRGACLRGRAGSWKLIRRPGGRRTGRCRGRTWPRRLGWGRLAWSPEKRDSGPDSPDAGASGPGGGAGRRPIGGRDGATATAS